VHVNVQKFQNSSESFHRLTDRRVVFKFREIRQKEIREIVLYLPDQRKTNFACLSKFQTVATARIAPKICRGQPQQCTQSVADFFQIGSLSAGL